MEIITRKDFGSVLANYLRQVALTQLEATSIIGYSVGEKSTIIATENSNVLEDMVEFGANLSQYIYSIDEDYKKLELSFNKVLTINDIMQAGITVKNPNNLSGELIHSLGEWVTVTIYLRKARNIATVDDNKAFLDKKGVNINNIYISGSRFRKVKYFKYTIEPIDLRTERINAQIEGFLGESEADLLSEILNEVDSVREEIG